MPPVAAGSARVGMAMPTSSLGRLDMERLLKAGLDSAWTLMTKMIASASDAWVSTSASRAV